MSTNKHRISPLERKILIGCVIAIIVLVAIRSHRNHIATTEATNITAAEQPITNQSDQTNQAVETNSDGGFQATVGAKRPTFGKEEFSAPDGYVSITNKDQLQKLMDQHKENIQKQQLPVQK